MEEEIDDSRVNNENSIKQERFESEDIQAPPRISGELKITQGKQRSGALLDGLPSFH